MTVSGQLGHLVQAQPRVIYRCADCLVRDPSGWIVDRQWIYCLPCAAKRYWEGEQRYFPAAAVVDWRRIEASFKKED